MKVKKPFLSILLLVVLLLIILTGMGVSNVSATSVKDSRKRAEEKLLPLEGVAGVSHSEEPPRIIVYIEHEKYKSKIPDEIEGFKTEVIVTGRIKALALLQLESTVTPQYDYGSPVSRTGIVRPIAGGISCGVPETAFGGKMAGTLSIVTNYPYVLSCAHVIAMNKNAKFLPLGTPVLQPGTYDGGTDEDKVGELYKYIKITFNSYRANNYADAAIATLTTTEYLETEVLGADNQHTYTISGTAEVNVGDRVRKSGRTTGVTENIVTDTTATVRVWYTSAKWAIFKDQIIVEQPFIQSGDSGSLVDKDGRFVGLAFAGSDIIAVVCKAKYIMPEISIALSAYVVNKYDGGSPADTTRISGTLTYGGSGLVGKTVTLSYAYASEEYGVPPPGTTWAPITSVETESGGSYSYDWNPPETLENGYYWIKASFDDENFFPCSTTTGIDLVPNLFIIPELGTAVTLTSLIVALATAMLRSRMGQ